MNPREVIKVFTGKIPVPELKERIPGRGAFFIALVCLPLLLLPPFEIPRSLQIPSSTTTRGPAVYNIN